MRLPRHPRLPPRDPYALESGRVGAPTATRNLRGRGRARARSAPEGDGGHLRRTCAADEHRSGLEHEPHGRRRGSTQRRRNRDRGGLAAADRPGALLAYQFSGDIQVQRREVCSRPARQLRRHRVGQAGLVDDPGAACGLCRARMSPSKTCADSGRTSLRRSTAVGDLDRRQNIDGVSICGQKTRRAEEASCKWLWYLEFLEVGVSICRKDTITPGQSCRSQWGTLRAATGRIGKDAVREHAPCAPSCMIRPPTVWFTLFDSKRRWTGCDGRETTTSWRIDRRSGSGRLHGICRLGEAASARKGFGGCVGISTPPRVSQARHVREPAPAECRWRVMN